MPTRQAGFHFICLVVKFPLQNKDASPPDIPNNTANKSWKLDFHNNPRQYMKLKEKRDSGCAYACFYMWKWMARNQHSLFFSRTEASFFVTVKVAPR